MITRESERLSRLIDNVLDFSRIEGGRRRYDLVPTPVEPLVREALEAFEYPLGQAGFRVEARVAPDLPEVVMDADAVGQALANLIDNAMKYSGERKTLRLGAEVRDGRLALSVEDEGIGIPREEQARIFEKFYRAGRSDTQGRRGSGVGLALVRHVAEAHGGQVTVDSRPGAGQPVHPLAARRRAADLTFPSWRASWSSTTSRRWCGGWRTTSASRATRRSRPPTAPPGWRWPSGRGRTSCSWTS